MADFYHYSQKPVSRSRGQSSVAGAAYRAAEKLYDQSLGQTFDYTRRSGVAHAEIVLPTAAVQRDIQWPYNRQALWNAAEAAERRCDSRIAREHEIGLPYELNKAQQVALIRAFALELANRYHVAVDFALHRPHRAGDPRNFHAHVYATTRQVEPTGLGAKAACELSDTDRFKRDLAPGRVELKYMRRRWEELANEHLRAHGIEAQLDHRSLAARGIERVPTEHLGVAATGLQRRGLASDVVERIQQQREQEQRRRLERAAELAQVASEEQLLARSILDLTGDIQAALRERDQQLTQHGKGGEAGRSVEDLQREGREAWLALRADRLTKEGAQLLSPEPSPHTVEPSRATAGLDEQRARAIEEWRKMREAPSPVPRQTEGHEQERQGPEIEGPEHEE